MNIIKFINIWDNKLLMFAYVLPEQINKDANLCKKRIFKTY